MSMLLRYGRFTMVLFIALFEPILIPNWLRIWILFLILKVVVIVILLDLLIWATFIVILASITILIVRLLWVHSSDLVCDVKKLLGLWLSLPISRVIRIMVIFFFLLSTFVLLLLFCHSFSFYFLSNQ
jgi:hypothetical protein